MRQIIVYRQINLPYGLISHTMVCDLVVDMQGVFQAFKTMPLSSPTGWLPVGQSTVVLAVGQLSDWERKCCILRLS